MELIIGLAGWIIQDGNYPDFSVGDKREFALEFYPISIASGSHKSSLSHQKFNVYDFNAITEYHDGKSCVIDFGIKAFQEYNAPKNLKVGDQLSGTLALGIDPYFYFERLKYKDGFPNIAYKWEILRIQMDTTPLIQTSPDGIRPKILERDKTRESYKDIQQTNAWEEINTNPFYFLHIKKL